MVIHLWHFTDTQCVKQIRTGGFVLRDDPEGSSIQLGVYFSLAGEMNWSHCGPGLIELWLDVDEHELASYKHLAGDGVRYIDFYIIPLSVLQTDRVQRWSFHDDVSKFELERMTEVLDPREMEAGGSST
jgi:hypothetical protein